MWIRTSAALLVLLFAVTACGGGQFGSDDPHGYEACELLKVSQDDSEEPVTRLGLGLGVGKEAAQSTDPRIRATVQEDPDLADLEGTMGSSDAEQGLEMMRFMNVNESALKRACEDNGFDF